MKNLVLRFDESSKVIYIEKKKRLKDEDIILVKNKICLVRGTSLAILFDEFNPKALKKLKKFFLGKSIKINPCVIKFKSKKDLVFHLRILTDSDFCPF